MNTKIKPDNKAVKPKRQGLGIGRKILIGATVGAIAFEGGGIGYDAATHTNEPLPISTMIDHPWNLGLSEIVPLNFDNGADSQTVTFGKNTIEASQLSGLATAEPVVKGQLPKVTVLWPLKMANGQTAEESVYEAPRANWMTGKPENSMPIGKILKISSEGTEIIVPVEGAEVFKFYDAPIERGGSTLGFYGFMIKFSGLDGTQYELLFENYSPGGLKALPALNNAPFLGDAKGAFASYFAGTTLMSGEKGLPISIGTPLAITSQGNTEIRVVSAVLADKVSGMKVSNNSIVSFNFDFATLTDSIGNQKIAVVPSK